MEEISSEEISSILADLHTIENDSIRGSNTKRLLSLLPQEQLRAATPESTALRRIVLRAAGGVSFLKRSFLRGDAKNVVDDDYEALTGSFLLVSAIIFDRELLDTDSELKTVANDALLSLSYVSALNTTPPLSVLSSGVTAADTIIRSEINFPLEGTNLSTILSGLCLSAKRFIGNTQYITAQTCALSCALHVVQNYMSIKTLQGTRESAGKNAGGQQNDNMVLDSVFNERSNVYSSLISVYSSSRDNGDNIVAQLAGKVLLGLIEIVGETAVGESFTKQLPPSWSFPFRYVLINDISQPDEGRLGDPILERPQDLFRTLSLRIISACIKVFGEKWLLSTLPQRDGIASSATAGEFALTVSRLIGANIKHALDEFEMCLILARGAGGYLVPSQNANNKDDINMNPSNKDKNNTLRGVAPLSREERTHRILPHYATYVNFLGAGINAYTSLVMCTAKMSSERSQTTSQTMALMRLYESIREVCSLLLSFISDAWGSDLRVLLNLPAIIPKGIADAVATKQQPQSSRAYSTDKADTLEEVSLSWRVLAVQPLLALCISGACTYLLEGGAEAFYSELVEALPCMMSERSTIATFTGVPHVAFLTTLIFSLNSETTRMSPHQRPNPFSALANLTSYDSWRLPLPDIPWCSKVNDSMNATIFNPKHLVIQVIGARISSADLQASVFEIQPSSTSNIISIAIDLLLSYCRSISLTYMQVDSSVKSGLSMTRDLIFPIISVTSLKAAIGTCQALLDLARTADGFKLLSSMANLYQIQSSFLITAQRLAGKRARGYAKDHFLNGSYVDGLQLSLARHLTAMSALSLWPTIISLKKSKISAATPGGVDITQVSESIRDIAFELFHGVVSFDDDDSEEVLAMRMKDEDKEEDNNNKKINLKLLDCILEIVGTGF